MEKYFRGIKPFLGLAVFFALFFASNIQKVDAAVLKLTPNSGTFITGDSFDVDLYLDTEGKIINTIKAIIYFSPEKLQLASPSPGNSIVGVWVSPPKYNERVGTIELSGGIPNGIKTNDGLISKFTFVVKSTGAVAVRVGGDSKVLLNDGRGTETPLRFANGTYELVLPPPEGPIVVSETHLDQTKWYSVKKVNLKWKGKENISDYSYMLDEDPNSVPDDISDDKKTEITYEDVSDGKHFFHIKELTDNAWGGTTHYAINIDSVSPLSFEVNAIPGNIMLERQPVFRFLTDDELSGIDHYELKIIPLQREGTALAGETDNQPVFSEASSPFISPELDPRDYEIIVRAYDGAGNYSDATQRIKIAKSYYRFITNEGIAFNGSIISWLRMILPGSVFLVFLVLVAFYFRKKSQNSGVLRGEDGLPQDVRQRLEELKKIKEKYGNLALILILTVALSVFSFKGGKAQAEDIFVETPVITNISDNISNEETFYVAGKTKEPGMAVVVYLQNAKTGKTEDLETVSDQKGDWFYHHSYYLSSGEYILWARSKSAGQLSSSSPQLKMEVRPSAIQSGSLIISRKTVYIGSAMLFTLIITGLVVYIFFAWRNSRKKRKIFLREVREAEEAVKGGFTALHYDMEEKLAKMRRAKIKGTLSQEEQELNKQLKGDFEKILKYIGKEIKDVEKAKESLF